MNTRHLNSLEKKYWLILVLLCFLYFVFTLLTWSPERPIPTPDGSYKPTKNAMTLGKRVITSLVYILILFVLFFLLKHIKRKWDILPYPKWLIKICIANFLIFIISQIIITYVTFKLTGDSISNLKPILRIYEIFWEHYKQDGVTLFYWYVQISLLIIWSFAKVYGSEMIVALFILISYILLSIKERKEHEEQKLLTQVKEQKLLTQVKEQKLLTPG